MTTPETLPPVSPSGETPTQMLIAEHAEILRGLTALEGKLAAWEGEVPPDRAYVEKAVEFLQSFADRCHHGKEEDILFKTMVDRFLDDADNERLVRRFEEFERREMSSCSHEALVRLLADLT